MLDWEQDLLSGLDGALVAVDDQGIIRIVNQRACDLLGWQSLAGRPLTDVIPTRMQGAHRAGFSRYVRTGESRLQGSTVRVPARREDGTEVEVDLTIRVFERPDGSRLATAALVQAATGLAPPHLKVLEDAFAKRLYELV